MHEGGLRLWKTVETASRCDSIAKECGKTASVGFIGAVHATMASTDGQFAYRPTKDKVFFQRRTLRAVHFSNESENARAGAGKTGKSACAFRKIVENKTDLIAAAAELSSYVLLYNVPFLFVNTWIVCREKKEKFSPPPRQNKKITVAFADLFIQIVVVVVVACEFFVCAFFPEEEKPIMRVGIFAGRCEQIYGE